MKKEKFSEIRRYAFFFLFSGLFLWFIHLEPPQGLSSQGHQALAVFFYCMSLWVFQILPLPVTGLFVLILLPAFGVVSNKTVYGLFGNEAVFFILSALILAAASSDSGLFQRVCLLVLRYFGKSPEWLIFGVMSTGYFLSYWMPEHAVCAFMFPIVLQIVRSLRLLPGKRYAQALFLALSWGVVIGGVTTFLGGARNVLAIAMLRETTGLNITFLEWIKAVAPMTLILLLLGYRILLWFFPVDIENISPAIVALENDIKQMGKMRRVKEWLVAFILIGTVVCWVFLGHTLGLASIAIGAVVVLFLFRLVSWRIVEEYVNWGIVLIYGGAVCLGSAVSSTDAALWLAENSILKFIPAGFGLYAGFSLAAWVITAGVSNSVVVAMLLPVALNVAKRYDLNPLVMTLVVAVQAGLDFSLPVGTPAGAIVYSSGYVRLRDMFIAGILFNIVAWLVGIMIMHWYWPLIGFQLGR